MIMHLSWTIKSLQVAHYVDFYEFSKQLYIRVKFHMFIFWVNNFTCLSSSVSLKFIHLSASILVGRILQKMPWKYFPMKRRKKNTIFFFYCLMKQICPLAPATLYKLPTKKKNNFYTHAMLINSLKVIIFKVTNSRKSYFLHHAV